MTGPFPISMKEICEIFSKVLNEPITFEYQSLDDFGKNNLSNDIPNWVKNLILEMYKDYEDGIFYLFEL